MSQRWWTLPEQNKAIEMRKAGKTYAQIGEAVGRSWKAVRHRLVLIGKQARPPRYAPQFDIKNAQQMRKAGLSYHAIAKRLGTGDEVLRQWLKRIEA